MLICALSSDSLSRWNNSIEPFAAWLHFNCAWSDREARIVTRLIANGCRFFLLTGPEYEHTHDMVDYIAMDETDDLVLTSFKREMNREAAFHFLTTTCPDDRCKLRIIGVLDNNSEIESEALFRMICTITEASDDY